MALHTQLELPPQITIIKDDPSSNNYLTRWLSKLWERVASIRTYSITIDPASIAANTTAEQTFTVGGITTEDNIVVSKPSLTAGIGIVNARASATDTIAITFINATGGAIDPPSEIYQVTATRRNFF